MIDTATLLTYIVIVAGFVVIPGPALLLTLARAGSSGTRVGIATGLGVAVGDLVHTAMAVFGLSAILMTSALLFSLIKYIGAAYLIYLGVRAILERAQPLDPRAGRIEAPRAFREAVLAEVLNPKSALFFLAFLPQFVHVENGAIWLQLTVLGVIFVALGAVSTVCVAVSAGALSGFLRRNATIVRWQGKVVGTIYCGLGVRLALQER